MAADTHAARSSAARSRGASPLEIRSYACAQVRQVGPGVVVTLPTYADGLQVTSDRRHPARAGLPLRRRVS